MARILIADDDPISREVLAAILEGGGHVVTAAENGEEAARLYRENPPDLIVLDIFMPEQDGLETLRELRYEYPDMRAMAISGGSAYSSYESLQWAANYGAQKTLTKPFEAQAILLAVDELLAG